MYVLHAMSSRMTLTTSLRALLHQIIYSLWFKPPETARFLYLSLDHLDKRTAIKTTTLSSKVCDFDKYLRNFRCLAYLQRIYLFSILVSYFYTDTAFDGFSARCFSLKGLF